MSKTRRFLTTAALALCSLLPSMAMAQTLAEVLLLATGETAPNYQNSITNLKTALENQAPSGLVDFEGTLDANDISSNLSQYKTIVVATGAKYITDKNLQTLATQIKGNPNQAFIIFSDSANSADNGGILSKFTDMLRANDATGMPLVVSSTQDGANETIARNTASGYSGYFNKLADFKADYYRTIAGASEDNVLYRAASKDALAIFVPQTQMNGGNGACTFLASDLTIFTGANNATKRKNIAQTLLDNVKPGSDACKASPPGSLPTVLYLSTAEQYRSGNPCTDSYASDDERRKARDEGKPYRNNNASNGGRNFIRNARNFFSDRVGTSHFINREGALSTINKIGRAKGDSEGIFTDETTDWDAAKADFANLKDGDVVVVQTAYQLMDETKANTIVSKIKEPNKKLTFILLLDACTDCSYDSDTCSIAKCNTTLNPKCDATKADTSTNLSYIIQPAINGADALGWGVVNAGMPNSTQWTAELDAHNRSAYASSLTNAVNQLGGQSGNSGSTLQCAPQQNILYPAPTPNRDGTGYQYRGNGYDSGWYCNTPNPLTNISQVASTCAFDRDTSAWPELNSSSSFGLIVPFWQSNNGQGACVYLGQDNNIFDNGRCNVVEQCDALAQMFLSLPAGACAITPQQAAANASALSACANLAAGERCILAEAPAKPDGMAQMDYDETLAVLHTLPLDANGEPMCKAKVWCSSNLDDRKDFCDESKGEDESKHCCKNKPICTEGQAISSPCTCQAPMQDDGSGKCITPPTPPICTDGQAISTGCTCQSPMEVQNGVCISSTPICSPPSGCSSAPTTGWPALLGLGALLPLLAARRRRRK